MIRSGCILSREILVTKVLPTNIQSFSRDILYILQEYVTLCLITKQCQISHQLYYSSLVQNHSRAQIQNGTVASLLSSNNSTNKKLRIWSNLHFRHNIRAVTIHQTHDSVRITIFDPRFGSYHDFFVGGGRKKKKDF